MILIVENQYSHYNSLTKGLEASKIKYCPKDRQPYSEFISAVKVYLNEPGYSQKYREACWEYIKSQIIDSEGKRIIDLIVMDNVLGGSTVCKTGQDLARDIWENVDKTIPVLFLSRMDYSDEKRFLTENYFKKKGYHFEWLMKGFLGTETMEDPYIMGTVVKKIKELLGREWPPIANDNQNLIDIVKSILDGSGLYRDDFENLVSLLESIPEPLPEDHQLAIRIKGLPRRRTFDEEFRQIVEATKAHYAL